MYHKAVSISCNCQSLLYHLILCTWYSYSYVVMITMYHEDTQQLNHTTISASCLNITQHENPKYTAEHYSLMKPN